MKPLPHTAMIFAAGLGERMKPLTDTLPKPMVPVNGKPLIDYKLDALVKAGVKRAVINTFHLGSIIEMHVGKRTDIEILISHETVRLETGGGLMKALPLLGNDPFYIINSDVIWRDDKASALERLAEEWDASIMDALLLLHPVEKAVGYHGKGDFDLSPSSQIVKKEGKQPFVFTGIQIFHPKLLAGRSEQFFSLSEILFKAKQSDGTLSRLFGLVHTGDWLHIGSPEELKEAEAFLSRN